MEGSALCGNYIWLNTYSHEYNYTRIQMELAYRIDEKGTKCDHFLLRITNNVRLEGNSKCPMEFFSLRRIHVWIKAFMVINLLNSLNQSHNHNNSCFPFIVTIHFLRMFDAVTVPLTRANWLKRLNCCIRVLSSIVTNIIHFCLYITHALHYAHELHALHTQIIQLKYNIIIFLYIFSAISLF